MGSGFFLVCVFFFQILFENYVHNIVKNEIKGSALSQIWVYTVYLGPIELVCYFYIS